MVSGEELEVEENGQKRIECDTSQQILARATDLQGLSLENQ